MKIYRDTIQGSFEWHQLRYGKITGSDPKSIIGSKDLKELSIINEMIAELTRPFELDDEGFISKAMQRGHDLEPSARLELQSQTGLVFNVIGFIERSGFHGHSPHCW